MSRILVVEDTQDINELVCHFLESEGPETTKAVNGEIAIKILEKDKDFQLIILDIIMPRQDGFDVINELKEQNIDIPVLGISGGGRTISGEVALKAVEPSVTKVLKKPFTKNTLMQEISDILG